MNPVTLLTSLVCKERFQLLCVSVEVDMKKTHNVLVKSSNPGGGGGTLIFSSYIGSGQASTVYPQKYQEFQAPKKNIWIFETPKKFPILYLDLKKRP